MSVADKLSVIARANARLQESLSDTKAKEPRESSLAISVNGSVLLPPDPETKLSDTPVCVCKVSDLPVLQSRCVIVHNRQIMLFHRSNGWFAMDAICYHMGGPLMDGNIVDIEEPIRFRRAASILGFVAGPKSGREVVVCPWHSYRITLDTGEGMILDMDSQWKSKGVRQRTHKVSIINGNVVITLSSGKFLPSDEYCNRPYLDIVLEKE